MLICLHCFVPKIDWFSHVLPWRKLISRHCYRPVILFIVDVWFFRYDAWVINIVVLLSLLRRLDWWHFCNFLLSVVEYCLFAAQNFSSLLESSYNVNVLANFSFLDQWPYTFVEILCLYNIFLWKWVQSYLSRHNIGLFFDKLWFHEPFRANGSTFG